MLHSHEVSRCQAAYFVCETNNVFQKRKSSIGMRRELVALAQSGKMHVTELGFLEIMSLYNYYLIIQLLYIYSKL